RGLGWEQLRALNPRLIYAGITGFGREGPYGQWPGVDQIAQGMSGFMSITGQPDGPPTRVGVPIGDLVAGMWAAIGVHAALMQRQVTGRGQRVETSLLASLVGLLCVQGQRYLSLEEVPKRQGNDHPVISPYGTFEASDGPFNMAAATEDMWLKLCGLLDLEELAQAPEFKDNTARMKNRDELTRRLNERFKTRTRAEWTSELVRLGLPAGPIFDMADVFNDAHVQANRLVEEVTHPVLGPLRQLANPVRLDAMEGRSVRTPPPLLGEHSEAVLADWGIPPERAAALIAKGTVRRAERST
ncbi:MAG: CoA transferase, partial [Rhodospirillales bacterium]|nr:CoA transferase [Rhodospirillales bacterium]